MFKKIKKERIEIKKRIHQKTVRTKNKSGKVARYKMNVQNLYVYTS